MNIRQAILAAANHLELNPESYDFQCGDIPGSGPGCLIVWACRFAGIKEGDVTSHSSPLGFGFMELTDFAVSSGLHGRISGGAATEDARVGAALLRDYANIKFPAAPVIAPNWQALAAHQYVPESARDEALDFA